MLHFAVYAPNYSMFGFEWVFGIPASGAGPIVISSSLDSF